MHLEGWLFDVYPGPDGMVLWVQDAAGRPHRLIARYHPGMFVAGSLRAVEAAERALRPLNVPVVIRPSVQRDLMSGNEVPVFRVAIGNPLAFPAAARRLARIPGLTLYNCDIPTSRLFFYEMGLFPLVRCRIDAEDGLAHRLEPLTRPDDLEYDLPPLVVLRLRLISPAGGEAPVSPAHGRRGLLEAGVDGETVVVDGDDPAQCLRSLNRLLARYDPDVILTEWGDAVLLPRLRALAARTGIPLALNRDPHSAVRTRRARSYVTYGQVVHQAGAQMLYGRWHIDLRNSFIWSESELAGLLEVARLSGIPVQDQARTSTGTAISSMQVQQAVRDGILIPWQKSEPEGFKTASQLILTDKGGLTYQPLVGLYEQVGELDFSSMYPTMMASFNISPETIGCACCPDSRVPEINYSVCRKRRGLVPRVLDHLLERRIYYKRRKNETTGAERALYDQRQTALKWCLVTCLDGDTLVPVRRAGQVQVKPIREVVDAYLPAHHGVLPVQDLKVFGFDEQLRPVENTVKNIIKVPAPHKLLRVRLQSGRELRMIPGHRCFVVEQGRLVVKRATELQEGDLIPVASRLVLKKPPAKMINMVQSLLQRLPPEEHPLWRVFGGVLRARVADAYEDIQRTARGHYTDKSIWNWREYGYLPLYLVPHIKLRDADFFSLTVGRGKRMGGIIQQIPVLVSVDWNLGFLLGFFVGDGNGRRTFLRFGIGRNEPDVARKLHRIFARKFRLQSRLHPERKAQMDVLQVNSVALARIFEVVFNVGKAGSTGKLEVPQIVWDSSEDCVYGFVSGLIASDGCVGKQDTFLRISTASRPFRDKVGMLLAAYGVTHDYRAHGHLYPIEIVKDGIATFLRKGWLSEKHRATLESRLRRVRVRRSSAKSVQRLGPFRCFPIRTIDKVAPSSPFVYCFEVEKKLDGFIVNGGIFTANSFGYLGYSNARFGRIEAHEAVTAFSREMLLQAKEVAEARGYRMLHALVDSMWLQRPGATREDYEVLAREVTEATGLTIFVEGVYRWLAFLPSKMHKGVGVPNRYMGVFEDGSTKVRGIEVRRSDVPAIVETTQTRMLQRMFACRTLEEVRTALPELLGMLEEALVRLRAGEVTPEELVVTTHLSQEVADYRHNTVQAITARSLDRHGADLHPGEAIQYIITDRDAALPDDRVRPYTLLGSDWSYDAEAYAEMLVRAGETVLELFGWTKERLRDELWSAVQATPASPRSGGRSGPTARGSGC